jgi:hypothetical protein
MHRTRAGVLACVLALSATVARPSRADDVDLAREAFKQGAALAKDTQWGAALAAFQRSSQLYPSAGTTYNIGVCERALGQYVRARRTLSRALEERRSEAGLPDTTVADIKRFVGEIDGLVATIEVSLAPADAAIAVDGQPLERAPDDGGVPLFFAGTLPAGPGKPVGTKGRFKVAVDPGTHVFVISREGFADAIHVETVRPGEKRSVEIVVERLPATLTVSADRPESVVTVNAVDVGLAPVQLSRPAGRYRVAVRRPGFVTYEVDASLRPGEKTELRARLEPEKPSLLTRWVVLDGRRRRGRGRGRHDVPPHAPGPGAAAARRRRSRLDREGALTITRTPVRRARRAGDRG